MHELKQYGIFMDCILFFDEYRAIGDNFQKIIMAPSRAEQTLAQKRSKERSVGAADRIAADTREMMMPR